MPFLLGPVIHLSKRSKGLSVQLVGPLMGLIVMRVVDSMSSVCVGVCSFELRADLVAAVGSEFLDGVVPFAE